MPATDLLSQFGLEKNPFTDRTAENTTLNESSLYVHSDLKGFQVSDRTYVFFGKRGSGKTTIRIQMMTAYNNYNIKAQNSGKKGVFVVNLCDPGHITTCLSNYKDLTNCPIDAWDAHFEETWSSQDMVDVILSYVATQLVNRYTNYQEGDPQVIQQIQEELDKLKNNETYRNYILILIHLYAQATNKQLNWLRQKILPFQVSKAIGYTGLGMLIGGSTYYGYQNYNQISDYMEEKCDKIPFVQDYPMAALATLGGATLLGSYVTYKLVYNQAKKRALAIQNVIRITKPHPTYIMADLLNQFYNQNEGPEKLRLMCIGFSAQQKLEKIQQLIKFLGFDSLAVFGDCFDEVSLLDPVIYPRAIKAFARETCRNDILNFGRIHIFFPDSRQALDLNTDKTLKEARFDRHFVRDLSWTRHQLEELAERRFKSSQIPKVYTESKIGGNGSDKPLQFMDIFRLVPGEDFSSYLSKIGTPRELMIMMTEMFSRIESSPDGKLTSQDMEIAVSKAQQQAV